MSQAVPSDAPAQAGQLAKGQLRTIDAIAISVSGLSPGMAMQLNTGGVAAVAGGSTALSGGGIWVPGAPSQRKDGYVQRCLSNPEVLRIALTNVRQ